MGKIKWREHWSWDVREFHLLSSCWKFVSYMAQEFNWMFTFDPGCIVVLIALRIQQDSTFQCNKKYFSIHLLIETLPGFEFEWRRQWVSFWGIQWPSGMCFGYFFFRSMDFAILFRINERRIQFVGNHVLFRINERRTQFVGNHVLVYMLTLTSKCGRWLQSVEVNYFMFGVSGFGCVWLKHVRWKLYCVIWVEDEIVLSMIWIGDDSEFILPCIKKTW